MSFTEDNELKWFIVVREAQTHKFKKGESVIMSLFVNGEAALFANESGMRQVLKPIDVAINKKAGNANRM